MSISVSGALLRMAEENAAGVFMVSKHCLSSMQNGGEIINCSTYEASEKLFKHALVVLPSQDSEDILFFISSELFRDSLAILSSDVSNRDDYADDLYLTISLIEGLVETKSIDIEKYRILYS
jgi:hypothetical protein